METDDASLTHATASDVADAPAQGTQGAGEKRATGQRIKFTTQKMDICIATWNVWTGHHVGRGNYCNGIDQMQDFDGSNIWTTPDRIWDIDHPTPSNQWNNDAILLWWRKRAAANSLIIGNSPFQHHCKHQLIWLNPTGLHSDQLPFLVITSRCACNEGAWLRVWPLPRPS